MEAKIPDIADRFARPDGSGYLEKPAEILDHFKVDYRVGCGRIIGRKGSYGSPLVLVLVIFSSGNLNKSRRTGSRGADGCNQVTGSRLKTNRFLDKLVPNLFSLLDHNRLSMFGHSVHHTCPGIV